MARTAVWFSFRPLTGRSFLKLRSADGLQSPDTVSVPLRGDHFLNADSTLLNVLNPNCFRPLTGRSFLKRTAAARSKARNDKSFRPLTGRSFLKHKDRCAVYDMNSFRPLTGRSFLKRYCRPQGEQGWVSVPLRGDHFLNWGEERIWSLLSFRPLTGRSFLKQDGDDSGLYDLFVSVPLRGDHFLNKYRGQNHCSCLHVSVPLRGDHFLNVADAIKYEVKEFPSPYGEIIS